MAKKLLLFLLIASCTSTNDVLPIEAESNTQTTTTEVFVEQSLTSQDILIEIFNAYQAFSDDPIKAVDTIWNYAHEDNKEATGQRRGLPQCLSLSHMIPLLT